MLGFNVSEWTVSDVQAVQQVLETLPGSIRTKLENLVLDVVCPDAESDPVQDSDGDFLYKLVQVTN
jgi:hypothetical protein